MTQSLYESLVQACLDVGIDHPDSLPSSDGRWHPANLADDRNGKGDGRIKLFLDGQGGIAHNWKGESKTFFISQPRYLSPDERKSYERRRKESQEQYEANAAEIQKKAQTRAMKLWKSAKPAQEDHPYLLKKKVRAHGLKVSTWIKWRKNAAGIWEQHIVIENTLLVPMIDETGQLWNVQGIFPAKHPDLGRDKEFISGARKSGVFYPLGCRPMTSTICIAEGFATGATIHETTGQSTLVAFDAGNLEPVARIIRQKYPLHSIIICADHDRYTKGNPGLTKARSAAKAISGKVLIPRFQRDQPGSDFNDLLRGNQHEA